MSNHVDIIIQSTRELLANRMNELDSLLDMNEFRETNYYLESIFHILFNREKIVDNLPLTMYLDRSRQVELARICIRVIDCEQSIGQASFYAMRTLALLVKQLANEPITTQETLVLVFTALVDKLQPQWHRELTEFERIVQHLSVYCLNQMNLKHLMSPEEAHRLIRFSLFPLAVLSLTDETEHKRSTFHNSFELGFHDLCQTYCDDNVLIGEPFYTYPLLIRLLVVLTKQSAPPFARRLKAYPKKFYSMLIAARSPGGTITDGHIVALNVIIADYQDNSLLAIEDLKELLLDLLANSEGIHRVHIAYLTHKIFGMFSKSDGIHEQAFANMMVEDVLTKSDELLIDIALSSLWHLQTTHEVNWNEATIGKETMIIERLLEIQAKPEMSYMFLKGFNRLTNAQESKEFDELARIPISRDIIKLDHLLSVRQIDYEQRWQLEVSLGCLASILRLRRHRLELAQEIKLNELFSSLMNAGLKPYSLDPIDLFLLPNSYQVYSSIWLTLIESLRVAAQPWHERYKTTTSNYIDNPLAIYKMLSHFLMIDGDNFHNEFGSLDVLKLIYGYCEKLIELRHTKVLLKEILLTWPIRTFKNNKRKREGYQIMLDEFIKLLISSFAFNETESNSISPDEWLGTEPAYDQYIDLLFGLVIAFCYHSESLYDMMASLGHRSEDCDTWVRERILDWTRKIVLYHENHYNSAILDDLSFEIDFGSVSIAYEGYEMINDEFYDCPEFSGSAEALSEFIRSSCDKGVRQSPVNSIMSKLYQRIKASLPRA